MDFLMGAALVTVGAAVGAVIAVLACVAGRTTAYLDGYKLGLEDGKLEVGGHGQNEN